MKWFDQRPNGWDEFRRRYREGLRQRNQAGVVLEMFEERRRGDVDG